MENLLLKSKREHEFEVEGVVAGEEVKGKFKCKYPSIMDNLEIDTKLSTLIEGANPATLSNRAYDLAYMIAYNNVLLLEFPKWYDLEILDDDAIVQKVYMEIVNFVNSFRYPNETAPSTEDGDGRKDKKTLEDK